LRTHGLEISQLLVQITLTFTFLDESTCPAKTTRLYRTGPKLCLWATLILPDGLTLTNVSHCLLVRIHSLLNFTGSYRGGCSE
jgi:hypothetical protein